MYEMHDGGKPFTHPGTHTLYKFGFIAKPLVLNFSPRVLCCQNYAAKNESFKILLLIFLLFIHLLRPVLFKVRPSVEFVWVTYLGLRSVESLELGP